MKHLMGQTHRPEARSLMDMRQQFESGVSKVGEG